MMPMSLGKGPFSYRPFRRITLARSISALGSWMQTIAAGWLVFHLSGSAMDVGVLAALATGPSLIGTPIGGMLADRYCPRKLAIGLSWAQTASPALLAVLAFADELTVPLIFLLVFLGAIPNALRSPIIAVVVPFTVPQQLRHAAVADGSAAYNISVFAGAVLGGAAVQLIGVGAAFAVNAISFACVALVLMQSPVLQPACDMARNRHDASLVVGLKQGWPLDFVRTVAYGAAIFFVLIAPIQQLMPTIAAQHGEGAMLLGVLLGAMFAGGLLANHFVRRWVTDGPSGERALTLAVLVSAIPTLLLGFSRTLPTDILLLVVIGFCWELVFVSSQSTLQLDVPVAIRGRMIGLLFTLVSGGAALGALAVGYLFQKLGVDYGLLVCGAAVAICGTAITLRRLRRAQPRA